MLSVSGLLSLRFGTPSDMSPAEESEQMPRLTSFGLSAVALMVFAMIGCDSGDGLDRQVVTGKVTLDGKPLPTGSIQFVPDAPSEKAVSGGGAITEGQYTIDRETGLIPGKYKVSIYAASAETPKSEAPGTSALPKELIPSKYNTESTLTAEVKSGGTNSFDFELTTK